MNREEQEQIDFFLDRMNDNKRNLEHIEKEKKRIEFDLKQQLDILEILPFPTEQDKEMIKEIKTALSTQ